MQVQIQVVCNRVFDDLTHIVAILEQYRNAIRYSVSESPNEAFNIAKQLDLIAFEGCR